MNTSNSRITWLWQQFSARKASRAELDELMELLSSGVQDETSLQYLQQLLESTPEENLDRARWNPVLQSILHPIHKLDLSAVARERHFPVDGTGIGGNAGAEGFGSGGRSTVRRIVRAVMGAAAILLLTIGFVRLWRASRVSKQEIPVAAEAKGDVAPGGNRAILTLSGGQRIMLDSAANGDLATQGSMHIQKLGDGRLAYEAEENSGAQRGASGGAGRGGDENLYNTLTTPKGGQYQLTLPDGTKVWLNAASSITYPAKFTGRERVVDMSGEAYFEIARDKQHPFKVKAGGRMIEDIGTHFNVNAYADEPNMVTTLVEGAIRIGGSTLKPGQKAVAGFAGAVVVSSANIEQALAWKNGLFYFSDADLKTVMRQLGRWYNVDIKYEGDVPARQFDGMIGRSLTLAQVLKGLTKQRVHYRIEGDKQLIITP